MNTMDEQYTKPVDEYQASFDLYDKNKDNVIDKQEAKQVPEIDTQKEFSAADTDNDNQLTKQEFESIYFDTNKYKQVDKDNGLARPSMEQPKEISEKIDKTRQKRKANASQGLGKEASKKLYVDWEKLGEKVKKVITGLNDKISPAEVEQIAKEGLAEQQTDPNDTIPIQETTIDNRTETIKQAIKHIIKHGKSLPKDLKKKIQDIPYKFEPVDFTSSKKATPASSTTSTPLDIDESNPYYGISAAGSSASIPQSSLGGGSTGGTGGSVASGRKGSKPREKAATTGSSRGGGMSLPTEPQPAHISLGTDNFGIGEFSFKRKPIDIRMRKTRGNRKRSKFPDLSPVVDNHNDMNVPKQSKLARPIIKKGLYQDVDDKYDSDIYSKIIDCVVNNYKDWYNKNGIYMFEVRPLNIKVYYDTVSQPKIKYQSGQVRNISSLLKMAGGKQVLAELYKYVQGGKKSE